MGELIKKVNWHSIDDAAQFESWLSEQAKKGLLFRKMQGVHIWFEQTEPYDMEYRIVRSKANLTEEQRCRYEQLGWKVVFYTGSAFILAGLKEDKPSELYFGEKEEKDFNRISKGLFWLWVGLIAFWSFLWIDMFVSYRNGLHFNWMKLFESSIQVYNPPIFMIVGLSTAIIPYFIQKKYIKEVKEKGIEVHHIPWKKSVILRQVEKCVLVLLMVLICTGVVRTFFDEELSESEALAKYPFIESGILDRNKVGQKYDSSVYSDSSLLCKENCRFIQYYGENENEKNIEQRYYELRSSWNQSNFMKSVLEEKAYGEAGELQELSKNQLDFVYYMPDAKEAEAYQLIASKGNRILYISYEGELSKDEILQRMEQELK